MGIMCILRDCNLRSRYEAYLRIRHDMPRHLRNVFSLVQQVIVPSITGQRSPTVTSTSMERRTGDIKVGW